VIACNETSTSFARGRIDKRSDFGSGAIFANHKPSGHTAKYGELPEPQGSGLIILVVSRRRDRDITTIELNAAWQNGRKESFCPNGKLATQTLGEKG
jgi:hypothetical protein